MRAIAVLASISDAQAHDALRRLSPSSPWNADWAENACRLQRVFGTGDDLVLLRFSAFTPGSSFRTELSGQLAHVEGKGQKIGLSYLPDPSRKVGMRAGVDGPDKIPTLIFTSSFARDEVEQAEKLEMMKADANQHPNDFPDAVLAPALARDVTGMRLDFGTRQLELETGAFDKALAALNRCADNLLKTWGIDPEINRLVVTPVKLRDNQAFVRKIQFQYPLNLARQNEIGLVSAVATVDDDGKATSCRVPQSLNDKRFDDLVCEELMRTQYEPARLADGMPVVSYYSLTVHYSM
ncbi:energy transducer TonB [Novosphingobium sp. MBES04]|uniref:energy transducer TonB n=1 Tax=Novosphingobium sp. MBES04 TaxID=1206458 RepID=UPI00057D7F10|nr:energy transducer TonB [Novosphingobium sp. MBES04]